MYYANIDSSYLTRLSAYHATNVNKTNNYTYGKILLTSGGASDVRCQLPPSLGNFVYKRFDIDIEDIIN